LALIILGPEKLPEAIRKFGQTYAEFKKVTTGFQSELKQALDEPMREMRETAEMFKQAATFDVTSPLEEAAASLKSVTEPGPAAVTPAPADRVDPAVSLAAADAADAAETLAAEAAAQAAAAVAAADAAGAAPPLASAATATPEPSAADSSSAETPADTSAADAPIAETPAPPRRPVAPKPPAAIDEEHRPFESKIISGGTRKPVTLDDVVARPDADAPVVDPGTPPA
jgi:Sec-independent protein translocase protein TatA